MRRKVDNVFLMRFTLPFSYFIYVLEYVVPSTSVRIALIS